MKFLVFTDRNSNRIRYINIEKMTEISLESNSKDLTIYFYDNSDSNIYKCILKMPTEKSASEYKNDVSNMLSEFFTNPDISIMNLDYLNN